MTVYKVKQLRLQAIKAHNPKVSQRRMGWALHLKFKKQKRKCYCLR